MNKTLSLILSVSVICLISCSSSMISGRRLTEIEMNSYQMPIIIGSDADVKDGTEYIILSDNASDGKYLHVVIPKGMDVPGEKGKVVVYSGCMSKITNMDKFKIKLPSKNYKYLIVESWHYK